MNTNERFLSLSAGAVALLCAFVPASIALAETLYGGVAAGASVQTQIETGNRGAAAIGATTSADVTVSGKANAEGSRNRAATSSAYRDDSRGPIVQVSSDANDELSIDHSAALQATTTIENSDEVHNRGELRSFLNHVLKADDRITDVHVSSTSVETQYSLPARFLWAIPTSIPAHVSIGADGAVTVTYPWYAFLFATRGSDLQAQLTQAASTTVGASASTTLSASVQAHLLNAILSVLKGN